MKGLLQAGLLSVMAALSAAACISQGDQNTINKLFQEGGKGTKVQLCQHTVLQVTDVINFTADDQEISTEGYPHGIARATIQLVPGDGRTTMIRGRQDGLRILNIQFDGTCDNAGNAPIIRSGANIEIGGGGKFQLVQYTASRRPCGWSCVHAIGSGNDDAPCANATIRDNDIGPAGQEGRNAQGRTQWADGISLECTYSLVQNNTVTGSTDGGIVIFGSPHSVIDSNLIIGSATETGFGAINMVDPEYNGSYDGVQVTNNVIRAGKRFNLGISIGSLVWSFAQTAPYLSGNAVVRNNIFSGNISFAMAISGWQKGLTIEGNDVSGITKPKSSFSDATQCGKTIQDFFTQDAQLVYQSSTMRDAYSLQSGFVDADQTISSGFLCTTGPLPSEATFQKGLNLAQGTTLAKMAGVTVFYQGDNNLVIRDAQGTSLWASGGNTLTDCTGCELKFDDSGNFATYKQGQMVFSTATAGTGSQAVFMNSSPYFKIVDARGKTVWDTGKH